MHRILQKFTSKVSVISTPAVASWRNKRCRNHRNLIGKLQESVSEKV